MKHKIILRVSSDIYYDTERYLELLDFCKKTKSIDEIIFFTQPEHAVQSIERIRKRLGFIGELMGYFRQLGIKLGIDVLCTLGHHEEHIDNGLCGFDFYTDSNGKINRGRLCSSSDKTIEYIKQVYSYAAFLHPDTIHIDDDLHYVVDCHCDNCEKIFSKKYTDTPDNRREFTKERLCNIFKVIEKTVHSIDKNIAIGWMTCHFGEDGTDYTDYVSALKGEKGKVLWRPGGGVYNEDSISALIKKAHSIGRQISALPDYVADRYGEIENFPYFPLDKNPEFMTYETLMYIAAGCNSTAFNMMSMYSGCFEDYISLLESFDDLSPFANEMVEKMANSKPCGIGKLLAKDINNNDATECDDIYNIGLPPSYSVENSSCFVMSKSMAKRLDKNQLSEVLSKGVMIDGETLEYFNSIGLGEYTGFSSQIYNVGEHLLEKTIDHPLNRKPEQIRDVHLSFGWAPSSYKSPTVYKIEKTNDKAEYLTKLIDYDGEDKGFTSGVFENKLGGRVYISGYVPFYWHGNLDSSENLKRVFRYLSRDTLPTYISSCHKIAIWSRGGVIAVANITTGKAKDVKIAILTEKNEILVCRKQNDSVSYHKITSECKDGDYVIFNLSDIQQQEVLMIL